ncbi:hypothetical protein, partial [Xanthomonas campestris]|uniref:hypothetical protein n=1 Tax=Xanthomonas campestris TaxID=339 RepID=UPI0039C03722
FRAPAAPAWRLRSRFDSCSKICISGDSAALPLSAALLAQFGVRTSGNLRSECIDAQRRNRA